MNNSNSKRRNNENVTEIVKIQFIRKSNNLLAPSMFHERWELKV